MRDGFAADSWRADFVSRHTSHNRLASQVAGAELCDEVATFVGRFLRPGFGANDTNRKISCCIRNLLDLIDLK
jgi:hypothetical protein